jgi:hypothetical protein
MELNTSGSGPDIGQWIIDAGHRSVVMKDIGILAYELIRKQGTLRPPVSPQVPSPSSLKMESWFSSNQLPSSSLACHCAQDMALSHLGCQTPFQDIPLHPIAKHALL